VIAARVLVASLAASIAFAAAACSLDWTVRADPGPAPPGIDSEAGAFDAPFDAPPDSTLTDAGGADCAADLADLAKKKSAAQACTLGDTTACKTAVKDECGCDLVVTSPGASATSDFTSAVAKTAADKCTPACDACASAIPQASWACTQHPDTTIHCFPP
jgi:hypothetical protein